MMKKLDSFESLNNAGEERGVDESSSVEDEDSPKQAQEKGDDGRHWLDYISSHPTTASRIERFEEAATLHQHGQN
jgi:Zn-dependent protease with chaperone function